MTKIVVAVKYVPDATADRTFESDNTVDRENVDGLLSELDEYAVEQALQVVEAGDGEVTVLTVGPDDAADAVRKALQMGADAGVHVVDDAIAGSDAFATSLVLAKAIEKLDYDLVFFGMASTDGGLGVVPTLVAERLAIRFASAAMAIRPPKRLKPAAKLSSRLPTRQVKLVTRRSRASWLPRRSQSTSGHSLTWASTLAKSASTTPGRLLNPIRHVLHVLLAKS